MQVFVRDNDINSALRVLKKKMQREGTFREMKRRRAYEKPSERHVPEKGRSDPLPPQDASQAAGTGRLLIARGTSRDGLRVNQIAGTGRILSPPRGAGPATGERGHDGRSQGAFAGGRARIRAAGQTRR